MADDIRLSQNFFSHPKTLKLRRRFGAPGVLALIQLWAFCGKYRQKGTLEGLDDDDLAIACGFDGDMKAFKDALIQLVFLDDTDGILTVHDWVDHNPFVFRSDIRSSIAKANISKRWERRQNKARSRSNTDGIRTVYKPDTPTPTPTPTPKDTCVSEFWNLYPHRDGYKINKGLAIKAIKQHVKPEEYPLLIQATRNYANSPGVQKGIGIKDPERFIILGRGNGKTQPWREWISPDIQTPEHGDNLRKPESTLDDIERWEKEAADAK